MSFMHQWVLLTLVESDEMTERDTYRVRSRRQAVGVVANVNSITSSTAELNISSAQPTFAKHRLCARYL